MSVQTIARTLAALNIIGALVVLFVLGRAEYALVLMVLVLLVNTVLIGVTHRQGKDQ